MVHSLFLALVVAGQAPQPCLVPARGYAATGYARTATTTYAAPAYHAPAAQYHAPQQTLVVGVPVTNLGLDYYYSVGDSLREERITQQVTKKVSDNLNNALNQASLRQQQEALKQQQAAFASQQAAFASQQAAFQQQAPAPAARPLTSLSMFAPASAEPEPQPQPQPQPQPPQAYQQAQAAPVPAPPAPQPPPATPPAPPAPQPAAPQGDASLDQQVSSIFEASCVSCHAPGKATPGVQLYGAAGDFYVASDRTAEIVRRTRIFDSVRRAPHAKPMPKNGNPLPQADVDTVGRWLITYVSGK